MGSIDVVVDKEEPNGCFITAGHGTPRRVRKATTSESREEGQGGYTFNKPVKSFVGKRGSR